MTVKDYFFVNCLYILCNVNILIIVTWLVILKANNRNTRTRCKIYSKLTIRTHGIYIVNFEHISHLAIVFLLLTLNTLLPAVIRILFFFQEATILLKSTVKKCR